MADGGSQRVELGQPCDECGGSGELHGRDCPMCFGEGHFSRFVTLDEFRALSDLSATIES